MGKDKKPMTWMKNHTLEGDGVLTGFYNHLWKRNKDFQSCKVMIPDTIVYDHNFPRSWFTYDKKQKNIEKRQGRDLDPSSINEAFSKSKDPDVGILASYLYSYEDAVTGETITSVEFFNERGLLEFVNRKIKREGILQKFVIPKGHNNSVIQAIWSPRVCLVQRRMNVNPIKDKLLTERDPYSCAVTYEGPTHFSEESTCAIRTTAQIEDICLDIVSHFHNTEHKNITRMVVYFKVDHNDKLWLLWCGSLRVADRQTQSQMPVNLSPIFTSPSQVDQAHDGASPRMSEKELLEMDMKHCEMTHDTIFKKSYITSPRTARGLDSTRSGVPREETMMSDQPQASTILGNNSSTMRGERIDTEKVDSDWFKVPGIQERYHELEAERDVVVSTIEDLFYEAYGHFLRHDPGPYIFDVDRRVAQLLGVEALQEMMTAMKVEHAPPIDDPTVLIDEDLTFWIPSGTHTPVTKLSEQAAKWLSEFYNTKERALREEAATKRAGAASESPSLQPPAASSPQPSTTSAAAPAESPSQADQPTTPKSPAALSPDEEGDD
eukprot:PhM_4_TR11664/c0_g1_i1/m.64158